MYFNTRHVPIVVKWITGHSHSSESNPFFKKVKRAISWYFNFLKLSVIIKSFQILWEQFSILGEFVIEKKPLLLFIASHFCRSEKKFCYALQCKCFVLSRYSLCDFRFIWNVCHYNSFKFSEVNIYIKMQLYRKYFVFIVPHI